MAIQRRARPPVVAPLLIQGALGVVLLLGFRLIIIQLPMLHDIHLPFDFTLAEVLTALIMTGVVAVLVGTAGRLGSQFSVTGFGFSQAGLALRMLAALISVFIVYRSYHPLARPYLGHYDWIYEVVFLAAALATLLTLGYALYTGSGELGASLAARPPRPLLSRAACGSCGTMNPQGSAFCAACGTPVKPVDPGACGSCGARMKPGARFCPGCGCRGESPKVVAASPEIGDACAACGVVLRPGAGLCSRCGAVRKPAKTGVEERPAIACDSCGATLDPAERFCGQCGSPRPG